MKRFDVIAATDEPMRPEALEAVEPIHPEAVMYTETVGNVALQDSSEIVEMPPLTLVPPLESHTVDPYEDVVKRAQGGDAEAFGDLTRATFDQVYTLAYRLAGNEADAHDIVQEAYLRAFKGLGKFRGDSQLSTWLYRITANCASTHLGKRAKHRHDLLVENNNSLELADTNPENDPQRRVAHASDAQELVKALDTLSPKLRAAIVLRDIYDLPHEAVAQELGISETAAKVRVHRARKALRELVLYSATLDD